jgi:hypothetical protein
MNIYKTDVGMNLTSEETAAHRKADKCYLCKTEFDEQTKGMHKVDHDHLTGKYRGAAHSVCNQKNCYPKFIPVVFHNLKNYDGHFIIQCVEQEFKKISCIPNNQEKYIGFSFDNLRFIDSFSFMAESLDSLTKNLKKSGIHKFKYMNEYFKNDNELMLRKGIYPYEYIPSFEKFNETEPIQDNFYSSLNNEHLTDADYAHFLKVWEHMKIKNLGEYHDLYLKTVVILLADIFENFRNFGMSKYGLAPAYYYTLPGFVWDSMLKMTNVKIELLTDIDNIYFLKLVKEVVYP